MRKWTLGTLILVASLVATGLAAPASAVALPGGKANWVAAVGGLKAGTSHTNWVRLGYYQFDTDGTAPQLVELVPAGSAAPGRDGRAL